MVLEKETGFHIEVLSITYAMICEESYHDTFMSLSGGSWSERF